MKTNYKYHALTGLVFIGIGLFFLWNSPEALSNNPTSGIQKYLPGVVMLWGGFKLINAYLLFKKQKNA
jgi:hypothetical protein